MKNTILSRRYARAIFQIAQETKTLDDVLQALNNFCEALKAVPELENFMANPLAGLDQIETLARKVTSNKLVLKALALLAKRRRLSLVPQIYEELSHMADSAHGVKRVLVKTATELSEHDKRFIEKHLVHYWNGQIIGRFQVAKDLIGGMWMQMGDKVLDASLRRRFDDLRRHLLHSAN